MTFKLLNWNVEWAKPGTKRGSLVQNIIQSHEPQVTCVTESFDNQFESGHTICADPDYGYTIKQGRRKVLLWSKEPWRDIDSFGHECLPTGRFVAGTTTTPVGDIRFVGVCIPWSAAHVSTGRKDRKR